jgi:polyhydroxyalkanoate synthesis repressor PhaR
MESTLTNSTRVIKKYPNRRLYDTKASSYITLSDVKQLVLAQQGFTVIDAKSGNDLTHSVLMQIILEEEVHGAHLLSSSALSEIIRSYGHAMQGMMGAYLEKNIEVFSDIQEKLTGKVTEDESVPADEQSELLGQFIKMQGPLMQGMMHNFIEQSRELFMQMQSQVAKPV